MSRLRPAAGTLAGLLLVAASAAAQTPAAPSPAEPPPGTTAPAVPAQASRMEMQHATGSGWAELDAFHAVLAASWHPAQKGDLAPARTRAAELSRRAQAWAASAAPASAASACRASTTVPAVRRVAREARTFARAAAARGTSDARLTATLRRVHDRFHVVEERCGAEHGGAEEHRH
jgi:hypothetical protein